MKPCSLLDICSGLVSVTCIVKVEEHREKVAMPDLRNSSGYWIGRVGTSDLQDISVWRIESYIDLHVFGGKALMIG